MGMHLQLFQSGFFGLFIEQTHLSYWHVLASFFCICFNFVCLSVCFFSLPLSLSLCQSICQSVILFCLLFWFKICSKKLEGKHPALEKQIGARDFVPTGQTSRLNLALFLGWYRSMLCDTKSRCGISDSSSFLIWSNTCIQMQSLHYFSYRYIYTKSYIVIW